MCRTVHALLQTVICGIQMLVRVFMTVILMIENLIRMILQTLYNFISFMLQMISLVPICVVFLITSKLKCFMCGGGGPCPVNRGGTCDCLMSAVAIIILYLILRAIGLMDVIFYKMGYMKAPPLTTTPWRFVPTPGDITECSRNDSDLTPTTTPTTTPNTTPTDTIPITTTPYDATAAETTTDLRRRFGGDDNELGFLNKIGMGNLYGDDYKTVTVTEEYYEESTQPYWTTVVYYLVGE